MPKYQKLSEQDGFVTFNVISDDNKVERVTSILLDGETENQMMSRHAHHFNDQLIARAAAQAAAQLPNTAPTTTALPKAALPKAALPNVE